MPELPEVETMRLGIGPILGSKIVDVERPRCTRKPIKLEPPIRTFRRLAVGKTIVELGRAGKRVLVYLAETPRGRRRAEASAARAAASHVIVFEPRMSGLVLLAAPPTREHLRLRIELEGGPAEELLYWDRRGLGSVRLMEVAELERLYGADQLGPDALELSAAGLRKRLAASRRPIKVALLDQRAVAGIGNLYAAEILHLAKIHPAVRCCDLTAAQWKRLGAAVPKVLRSAIRYEGSTLSDGTYRSALNKRGGYQNKHRVYARAGKLCSTCRKENVERIVQAQRSTFYCPGCQKRRS